jgi:ketosteroid isomerase-like protein
MKRREFLAGTGILLGTGCVPSVSAANDDTAVKQTIKDVYSIFSVSLDKQKYRALLTDDYLLLENGELLDIEGDIALMPPPESGYKRTDSFDFRSVKVHGDTAYAVYFLKSEIADNKNGTRNREWLESAILRRAKRGWRMALLHSTRIAKSGA